jgi:hypothetical protein
MSLRKSLIQPCLNSDILAECAIQAAANAANAAIIATVKGTIQAPPDDGGALKMGWLSTWGTSGMPVTKIYRSLL